MKKSWIVIVSLPTRINRPAYLHSVGMWVQCGVFTSGRKAADAARECAANNRYWTFRACQVAKVPFEDGHVPMACLTPQEQVKRRRWLKESKARTR